jgi:hypothetical protein
VLLDKLALTLGVAVEFMELMMGMEQRRAAPFQPD